MVLNSPKNPRLKQLIHGKKIKIKKEHLDYLIVLFGQSFSKILMFIIYLLLPAIIGVSEYGIFSYTLSLCFIFSQPFIEFGLDPIVTKYISRGNYHIIKTAFLLRAKTSILGLAALLTASMLFKAKIDLVMLLFVYLLFFSFSNMAFAYLRGKEKFIYESILLPLFRGSMIILILLFSRVLLINNSYTGALPFALSSSLFFIIALFFLIKESRKDNNDKAIITNDEKISLFKEGRLLFLSSFLWMLYFRIDSIMLGVMIGDSEVGIYSLSYRLYEGSILLPTTLMMVVFPKISSYTKENLANTFWKGMIYLCSLSIFAFFILFFAGELIIKHFYNIEYLHSVNILKILSFSVFVVFPAHLTTQFLIARDKNYLFLIISLLGALFNIILNYILIPEMKSSGAAVSTVATEILILLLSFGSSVWIIKRKL